MDGNRREMDGNRWEMDGNTRPLSLGHRSVPRNLKAEVCFLNALVHEPAGSELG